MSTFYVSILVTHVRIAGMFNSIKDYYGFVDPDQIVGKNIEIDVVFMDTITAHKSTERSRVPILADITKQFELHQKFKGNYTPAAVVDIQPYVCLKFKASDTGSSHVIKTGTELRCSITDMSLYFKSMSSSEITTLIEGSIFVEDDKFSAMIQSIDANKSMTHCLYGTVIASGSKTITLTCGYKCIMVRVNLDIIMYDILCALWNNYISKSSGKRYIEKVVMQNNNNKVVYIMLETCKISDVLSDLDFLKGILM